MSQPNTLNIYTKRLLQPAVTTYHLLQKCRLTKSCLSRNKSFLKQLCKIKDRLAKTCFDPAKSARQLWRSCRVNKLYFSFHTSTVLNCKFRFCKRASNQKIKSLLYSKYYVEACNSGVIHLRGLAPGQRSSKETSLKRRAVGDTVFDLTDPRVQLQTSRTNSNVLTTELTNRF